MNALTTDFYEFTMSCGCLEQFSAERKAAFELFFRRVPQGGGYAIAAGGAYAAKQIASLRFTDEDICWLRTLGRFDEAYLSRLQSFVPSCDIDMVPEGTPVFPYEPILTVSGPAWEAQFLETLLLLTVNHQSLIATKAARICRAAQGRPVIEMGARRAHGADAAILGARSAYLGGAAATTCTRAAQQYSIPPAGTMAHSWVQMFDSEYAAFRAFAKQFPERCTFLVDTYDVLSSGIPNVIRVADEILRPRGYSPYAVRLDSGDLLPLSHKVRRLLDAAGYPRTKIMVSGSMDEHSIRSLLDAGAPIDIFGVGERLITARSEPVFGGVYKLAAVEEADGTIVPKIKISENVVKITNPHYKKLYRFFAKDTGKAIADYMTVYDEVVDDTRDMEIFDPDATWKTKRVYDFTAKELQVPIFKGGELVYKMPTLEEIRTYCKEQVDTLWDEVKRFDNPQTYYVDLSQKLWDVKYGLLKRNGRQ